MDDTIIARLWEIVQAVADEDCTYYDEDYDDKKCIFCWGKTDRKGNFTHEETCPKVKAHQVIVDRNARLIE